MNLTAEQRGQVFRALALAAAGDDENRASVLSGLSEMFVDRPIVELLSGPAQGTAALTVNAAPVAPRSVSVSLEAAAQSKVGLTGCPHAAAGGSRVWIAGTITHSVHCV